MKRILINSPLFFVTIFLISPFVSAQINVKAKRILVHAEKGWQDTGVQLRRNQFYSIYARGAWVSGYEVPESGPDGSGYGTITSNALVGYISSKKPDNLSYDSYKKDIVDKIVLIGQGGMLKAYGEGTLWLSMGDWSGCKECSGFLEVLIVVY